MAERIVVTMSSSAVGNEGFVHVANNSYVLSKEQYESLERAVAGGLLGLQSTNPDGSTKVA